MERKTIGGGEVLYGKVRKLDGGVLMVGDLDGTNGPDHTAGALTDAQTGHGDTATDSGDGIYIGDTSDLLESIDPGNVTDEWRQGFGAVILQRDGSHIDVLQPDGGVRRDSQITVKSIGSTATME